MPFDNEPSAVSQERYSTARIQHQCRRCGTHIAAGSRYKNLSTQINEKWVGIALCLPCAAQEIQELFLRLIGINEFAIHAATQAVLVEQKRCVGLVLAAYGERKQAGFLDCAETLDKLATAIEHPELLTDPEEQA